MTDNLERLAAIAAAATPGEWHNMPGGYVYVTVWTDPNVCVGKAYHAPFDAASVDSNMEENGQHIATFDPQIAAALVAVAVAARQVSKVEDDLPITRLTVHVEGMTAALTALDALIEKKL